MITVVVELRGDDRLDDIEDGEKSGISFFAAKTAFSPRRELLHPQLSPTFNFNPFNPPSPPFSTTCFGLHHCEFKPAIYRKCSLISRDASFGPLSTMSPYAFPDAAETTYCIPFPPHEYEPAFPI
jgi:hypothetical protein